MPTLPHFQCCHTGPYSILSHINYSLVSLQFILHISVSRVIWSHKSNLVTLYTTITHGFLPYFPWIPSAFLWPLWFDLDFLFWTFPPMISTWSPILWHLLSFFHIWRAHFYFRAFTLAIALAQNSLWRAAWLTTSCQGSVQRSPP